MKPTIAIMSPGDMGHAVGAVLRQGGLRVVAELGARSARTRMLAGRAGIEAVADDAALVREADMLLSILAPAEALALAERIARAVRETGATPLYVDCNAIAPQTARRIAEITEAAGARFVDAGIIGPPPKPGATATRFYASGRDTATFARLRDFGLEVIARRVFVLELFPYHSKQFGRAVVPSQAYTYHLLRRAIRRDALVIVMRGWRIWTLAVPELLAHGHCHRLKLARRVLNSKVDES